MLTTPDEEMAQGNGHWRILLTSSFAYLQYMGSICSLSCYP